MAFRPSSRVLGGLALAGLLTVGAVGVVQAAPRVARDESISLKGVHTRYTQWNCDKRCMHKLLRVRPLGVGAGARGHHDQAPLPAGGCRRTQIAVAASVPHAGRTDLEQGIAQPDAVVHRAGPCGVAPRVTRWRCTYSCPCSWQRTFWADRSFRTVPSGRRVGVRPVPRPAYREPGDW
jgi:hypothetical protein